MFCFSSLYCFGLGQYINIKLRGLLFLFLCDFSVLRVWETKITNVCTTSINNTTIYILISKLRKNLFINLVYFAENVYLNKIAEIKFYILINVLFTMY